MGAPRAKIVTVRVTQMEKGQLGDISQDDIFCSRIINRCFFYYLLLQVIERVAATRANGPRSELAGSNLRYWYLFT